MADGLSVAASIAGLVSLADVVVTRLYKYIKEAKGAEKEIAALTAEITSLYGILNSLRLVAHRFEGEELETTMQIHHIHSCYTTLTKIDALLEKDDPRASKSTMESFRRKLHWPLSKSETNKLIAEVERHKATLSLALSADGMSALLKALSRQAEIGMEIQEMAGEIRKDRETKAKVAINAKRQKILEYVSKVDPKASQATGLKLRQPGTGTWFTDSEEFRDWLRTKNAKLWLFGIPGAGKTILTSTIIQEAGKSSQEDNGIAYFFCDYKDTTTQDVVNLLGALAKQFAMQDEKSFELLENFYQQHLPQKPHALVPIGPPNPPTAEELHGLIQIMTKSFDNALIIVDGLDECTGDRSTVMEFLESLNKPGQNNIKTLFTSRDEYDIRERLTDYVPVSIAARSSDLRLYVASELEVRMRTKKLRLRDPALKEEIMTRLVEGAEGMFRWVTCQMDHLCELSNDRARRKALKSLPPDLPSTYERILERVNASSEENQIMVQRALRWIVCAEEPLSLAALAEALTINRGDNRLDRDAIPDEDAILHWCSSLVRRSVKSEGLELAHFTVKEFLLAIDPVKQNSFKAYRVQTVQCQAELAKTCLTYLCLEDFAGDYPKNWDGFEQRDTMYPFRRYAVCHWIKHAWATKDDEPLLDLMKILFEPVKSNQFISWTQDFVLNDAKALDYDGTDKFTHFASLMADSTLLHWAALLALPTIYSWLLMEGSNINKLSEVFGSPLWCAILGKQTFDESLYLDEYIMFERPEGPPEARDEVVKLLVENGANVNYRFDSMSASTPILLATLKQDESACARTRILLEAGALCDKICIDFVAEVMKSGESHLNDYFDAVGHRNLQGECIAQFVELASSFEQCPNEGILDKMISDSTAEGEESFKYHFSALLNAVQFGAIGSVRKWVSMYQGAINLVDADRPYTLLHAAAEKGHAQIIDILIQHGADVNREDQQGRTPLYYAAENGDLRSFLILVEKGSKIRQGDKDGLTAAHIAASCNSLEILETLESISDERLGLLSRSKDGQTPLLCAARSGSLEVVKFILGRFSNVDISECTEDGRSCLHLAAIDGLLQGAREKLQFFLDQGLDVNQRTRDGSTPLHFAALRDGTPKEVIELLLTHGADPSALREDNCSALHLLFQDQGLRLFLSADVVSLLLSAMDEISLNAKANDENGYTALHYCVSTASYWYSGNPDAKILDAVLDGSDINVNVLDNKQCTPLHLFIKTYRWNGTQVFCDTLEKLIGKGAAVNQKDISGRTPLHDLCEITYSVVNNFVEKAARILLDHGADLMTEDVDGQSTYTTLLEWWGKVTDRTNNQRSTADADCSARMFALILRYAAKPLPDTRFNGLCPLSLALKDRREDLVSTLLTFEPDVDRRDGNEFRNTPLEMACIYGCSAPIAQILVSLSKGLTDKHISGHDLLHLAAMYGSLEIVVELLNHDVDINMQRDSTGETPLMTASACGKVATVQLLIDKGADVAAKSYSGWNAIHGAVSHGHLKVLHVLQSTAIDWQAKATLWVADRDWTACTALHFAAGKGRSHIIEYLLESGRFSDVNLPTDTDHLRPLYIAAAAHHTHTVEVLLSKGADINLVGATGPLWTAFHVAAVNGFEDIVRLFLEHGGDFRKTDSQGISPELLALKGGHKSVVEMLRDASAKQVAESGPTRSTLDDAKRAPLIDQTSRNVTSQALKIAIEVGDFNLCKRLFEEGANRDDSLGCCPKCNPLLYSLHYGRPDIALFLVENGATCSEVTCECWDTQGYDAIHYAASYGYSELLELLLKQSPKPRPRSAVDPIHLAAAGEHLECLELLLDHDCAPAEPPFSVSSEIKSSSCIGCKTNESQGESLDRSDMAESTQCHENAYSSDIHDDHTPLKPVNACIQNHILDRPWRLNDWLHTTGTVVSATALHVVSHVGNVKIANLLLHRGANIEACTADEATPLHVVTTSGQKDIVQLLLKAGANINCRDGNGTTPALLASKRGNLGILDILREHKADFSVRDQMGNGCLHHAARSGHVLVLPGLMACGQDLTSANILGGSALHYALYSGSTDMETFFMDHATIHEATRPVLGNVLNVACRCASLSVVLWILKRMPEGKEHAFVNFRSIGISTPLIAAVYRGHSEMVEVLLDAGADIELSDGQFGTPLMTACALGRLNIAKILLNRGAKLTYSGDGTLAAMAIAAHHKNIQLWLRLITGRKPDASFRSANDSTIVEELDA